MKQKDIALIAVIVIISAVLSLVVSSKIFTSSKDSKQTVEVVQPITATFPQTDKRYFNKDSFDPTKQITIQQNANNDPFSGSSQ